VARAVVGRPQLNLSDEPTWNLDPNNDNDVQTLLHDLQRENACAMVVATHSEILANAMDRRLRLAGGTLKEEGSSR
jgi:predicted ABC-type transport system involved in lysophospholipase L1 biosynthesis ATPase subunit